MTPIETVQQIYAAFGRGDVPAILAHLADDVEWEYATAPNPIPWLQPLRGRGQVPKFFEALFAGIECRQPFLEFLVVGCRHGITFRLFR